MMDKKDWSVTDEELEMKADGLKDTTQRVLRMSFGFAATRASSNRHEFLAFFVY